MRHAPALFQDGRHAPALFQDVWLLSGKIAQSVSRRPMMVLNGFGKCGAFYKRLAKKIGDTFARQIESLLEIDIAGGGDFAAGDVGEPGQYHCQEQACGVYGAGDRD